MIHFMLSYSKLFYWNSSAFISSETTRHPWKLLAFQYPLVDIGHFLELSHHLLLQIFHYLHRRHRVSHSSQQVICEKKSVKKNISWNNGNPALLYHFAGVPWGRKCCRCFAKDSSKTKYIGPEVGCLAIYLNCVIWMFLASVHWLIVKCLNFVSVSTCRGRIDFLETKIVIVLSLLTTRHLRCLAKISWGVKRRSNRNEIL